MLIIESEARAMNEIIQKLDSQSIEDERSKSTNESWSDLKIRDYYGIINGLNSNSTKLKIKILDKLLNSPLVDTKQNIWTELSTILRRFFINASNEIFLKTLKIHYKIICFSNTTFDGYLNLLKGTILLFNSRYFNDLHKYRLLQCIKIIIGTLHVVVELLLHASHSAIDELIVIFNSVLTFKSVFECFGAVDSKSSWLKCLCYGTIIRKNFFNNLKEANSDFIKSIFVNFTKSLNNVENGNDCYVNFLLYFCQYKTNFEFLINEINIEVVIESVLIKINQKKKINLISFVINLFSSNPALLSIKLLEFLADPLCNINRNNIRNTLETNKHIFIIITNIARSPNYRILFENCNLRKGRARPLIRNCANLPQKIVELTIVFIRINLNNDASNLGDTKILLDLLQCCLSIYESTAVSLIHVNPTKLLENITDFYRLRWKNDIEIRKTLLSLFKFLCDWYKPFVSVLNSDEILQDLVTFTQIDQLKNIMNRISTKKVGFEMIKNHKKRIIKPYLEKILTCEDANDDSALIDFVFFLFGIALNTRSVVALLSDDDNETTTEVEESFNLEEILEKSLNYPGESEEAYVGLIAMKVFITNLDLLLYLQANYQMQDRLMNLEEETNGIVDAQKSLRNDILVSLEFVGLSRSNENFENIELQPMPQIFEFFRYEDEKSEFRAVLEEDVNDYSWLGRIKKAFKNSLSVFDPSLLFLLVEKIPGYRNRELSWPPADCVFYQLHPEDFCGISLIINFGLKTGLLPMTEDNIYVENLTLMLKQSRTFLGHQPENFSNFDWFVGVIFLISSGDPQVCQSTLINFTKSQVTSLVWATFGKEFDTNLQENFFQHLNVIVEENCVCFQALKMLGLTPEAIVQSWLNQCFLNCLKFDEICNFLAFSVLFPPEYILYYITTIFQHLNNRICTLTHSLQILNIFEMTNWSDFRLIDYFPLIEKLAKTYRNSHKL